MARAYQFRFETLLRLRRRREDECKQAVAARLRELQSLERRRDTLLERIREQTAQTRDALRTDSLDIEDLKLGRHWIIRLKRGVLDVQTRFAAQSAILEQERRRLAEASKDVKVLSRLQERQLVEHVAEMNRREQLELDEMNVTRHARAAADREIETA